MKKAQLLRNWKSVPQKQKYLTITAIIVGLILLLVVIDLISSKNIVGIQRETTTPTTENSAVYDTSKDAFQPSSFGSTSLTENGAAGIAVTITYPVTNNTPVDARIKSQLSDLARQIVATAKGRETYTAKPFAYNKYLFLTVANDSSTSDSLPFSTFAFNKKGSLVTDLLKGEYQNILLNHSKEALGQTFGTSADVTTELVREAIAHRTYRLASNGLVLQVKTKPLGSATANVPYYEILIPNTIIEDYIK